MTHARRCLCRCGCRPWPASSHGSASCGCRERSCPCTLRDLELYREAREDAQSYRRQLARLKRLAARRAGSALVSLLVLAGAGYFAYQVFLAGAGQASQASWIPLLGLMCAVGILFSWRRR